MEKYSEYKDSGVQWLGRIPGHWELCKMGFLFEHNTGKALAGSKNSGTPRPYITTSNLYWDSFDLSSLKEMPFQDDELDRYTIRKGDLLVCEGGDIGRSAIWNSDDTMYIQNHIHRLRPIREICTRYYLYYMFTAKSLGGIGGKGIAIQGFSSGALHTLKSILPPLPEQQAIVAFLDGKCGKIDLLMENKRKELDLLQEMKQRIIADAVTRGLDPSVKMKPSGIPWLPEIPEHWKVETLRKFLKLVSIKGHSDKQLLSVTREQGVIVRDTESKEENHNFIPEDLSGYKYVEPGDFCINKMKSWQGSYGVSDYEGIVSPAYYICKLTGVYKPFFSMAIRSKNYVSFFAQYSKGIRVDQWDLSPIALKSIPFFLPPEAEQRAIVSHINSRVEKIDSLASKLHQEIDNIKEYKQRLISDVVTGQIKVC